MALAAPGGPNDTFNQQLAQQAKDGTDGKCSLFNIWACLWKAVKVALQYVILGVSFIGSVFVGLASYLLIFALELNFTVTKGGIVGLGWGIVRDFANLGFVLAIIIIAVATILRFPGYGWREILWKLVAAALLVNFSLLFALVFVDFANVLTNFFLRPITGSSIKTLTYVMADALTMQAFTQTPPVGQAQTCKTVQSASGSSQACEPNSIQAIQLDESEDTVINRVVSVFFIVFFNFVLFVSILAVAVMLIIRYLALIILLILAPLAWLFWILPATAYLWSKWWHEFLRWVFFLPAVTFFIYLAMYMAFNYSDVIVSLSNASQTGPSGTTIDGFWYHLSNLTVILGILLGGLITADRLSIHGAKAAYGAATGGMKGFAGWTGRMARAIPVAAYRATPAPAYVGGVAAGAKGVGARIARLPVIRHAIGAGRAVRTAAGPGHKGPIGSIYGGMKKDSKLFGGKQAADWECQSCNNTIRATQKPKGDCPTCKTTTPDWQKV